MHQSVACHAVHRVLAAPVVQEDYIKDEMKNLKREMIRAKEVRGRVACAWSAVVYDRACWWFFQTAHGVDARVVLRARLCVNTRPCGLCRQRLHTLWRDEKLRRGVGAQAALFPLDAAW